MKRSCNRRKHRPKRIRENGVTEETVPLDLQMPARKPIANDPYVHDQPCTSGKNSPARLRDKTEAQNRAPRPQRTA